MPERSGGSVGRWGGGAPSSSPRTTLARARGGPSTPSTHPWDGWYPPKVTSGASEDGHSSLRRGRARLPYAALQVVNHTGRAPRGRSAGPPGRYDDGMHRSVLSLFAGALAVAMGLVVLGLGTARDAGRTVARAQEQDLGLELVDAVPGVTFARPILATQAPGDPTRLFVVQQRGRIRFVRLPLAAGPGQTDVHEFLDLTAAVGQKGNEQGLLGLAFHPGYEQNGRLFVHYTRRSDGATVLAEFARGAGSDAALPASERVLLTRAQPFSNHNGGMIAFGPDGYLYLGLGDGGSGGDPLESGQDLGTWLGKLLRIDVDRTDSGLEYAIPADNPFVGVAGALPEIWAYGLRNPWRFSFDRESGALWLGDVGQNRFEEIDRIERGGNYGWDRKEGDADFEPEAGAPPTPLLPPVHAYGHSEGKSVTGGVVYRGAAIPGLDGVYLFADYLSGNLWGVPVDGGAVTLLLAAGERITSFGEGLDGEVYLCSFSSGGRVLELTAPSAPPPRPSVLPERLSEIGLFSDLPGLVPVDEALPYAVRSALWSDGAAKDRFLVLPPGEVLRYAAEGGFDVPVGTWAVKTFTLDEEPVAARRLETRVILRTADGWEMAAYRWEPALGDALRIDDRTVEVIDSKDGATTWTYPSREDCRSCHTEAAGFLLGVTSRQIRHVRKRRIDLVGRWARKGLLAGSVPRKGKRPRNVPIEGRRRREKRVRSYLDANCAFCHQPDAPEPAGLDLRASVPLDEMGLLNAPPQRGDFGIAGARVVAPGDTDRSVLFLRMQLRDGDRQMPKLGTARPHARALHVVRKWIEGLR